MEMDAPSGGGGFAAPDPGGQSGAAFPGAGGFPDPGGFPGLVVAVIGIVLTLIVVVTIAAHMSSGGQFGQNPSGPW
jgi:hypothetical protein